VVSAPLVGCTPNRVGLLGKDCYLLWRAEAWHEATMTSLLTGYEDARLFPNGDGAGAGD